MAQDQFSRLEEALGYRFRERSLLLQAFTHSSRKADLTYSNERLEFLGDAILGATVSEHLYRAFPDYTEGDLTRIKSAVVSRTALTRVARDLDLGSYLIVAKGVAQPPGVKTDRGEPGQPVKKSLPVSLLSDAFEALIAAVYLDAGLDAAREFVLRHVRGQIDQACKTAHGQNFKSLLQQIVQRERGATPVYHVTAEVGPDHVKSFEVVTVIRGKKYGTGHGGTKKEAEQMAAEKTLALLGHAGSENEDVRNAECGMRNAEWGMGNAE